MMTVGALSIAASQPLDNRLAPMNFRTYPALQHALARPHDATNHRELSARPVDHRRLSFEGSVFDESGTAACTRRATHRRLLSDNELSYFLPSRGDGVNDIYLHHELTAPVRFMTYSRILHIWAYQLLRHPLLASGVQMDDYSHVYFRHSPPTTLDAALKQARVRLQLSLCHDHPSTSYLISSFLNGPRTLSNDVLGCLFLGTPAPLTPESSPPRFGEGEEEKATYEVMLTSTHFLGDLVALHAFMNEFYILVGSERNTEDFAKLIEKTLDSADGQIQGLPISLEDRLPKVGNGSRLAELFGKGEYIRSEARLIGEQVVARTSTKLKRKTIVSTFAYSANETKAILGKCKAKGVTFPHAMFALCNISWSRRSPSPQAPCMMYSALNLRPNMLPLTNEAFSSSFFHLALGYFNVVLPSLIPPTISVSDLFWHRARMSKSQTLRATKTPFLVSRSRETCQDRASRAIKLAQVDDEESGRNAGAHFGSAQSFEGPAVPVRSRSRPGETVRKQVSEPTRKQKTAWKPGQRALMGLSMLGNLDRLYEHRAYSSLEIQSAMMGTRQRPGGLLLFTYTFADRLWMSLGYDVNGFGPGVIEGFWGEVQALARDIFL